jgi:hypothetical protein
MTLQKRPLSATKSILPKALEPIRAEFRIAHRVCDVPVTEVLLDRSRIVPFVCELVAGGVPKHVRMDREGEFRELAGARNQFPGRRRRHRSTALRHEQVGRVRIVATQLAQRTKLWAADRVSRGHAVLESRDVHQASLKVNLLPAHRHELRDAQPMTVGEENERPIARAVAPHLARGLQQLLDLRRR